MTCQTASVRHHVQFAVPHLFAVGEEEQLAGSIADARASFIGAQRSTAQAGSTTSETHARSEAEVPVAVLWLGMHGGTGEQEDGEQTSHAALTGLNVLALPGQRSGGMRCRGRCEWFAAQLDRP